MISRHSSTDISLFWCFDDGGRKGFLTKSLINVKLGCQLETEGRGTSFTSCLCNPESDSPLIIGDQSKRLCADLHCKDQVL